MKQLPFDAAPDRYRAQAEELLAGHRAADPQILEILHRNHPRFLDAEIATCLLKAGAEPDALADLYSGPCTTISLLVSSGHPAEAGLQAALAITLLDFGASIEDPALAQGQSPLMTALAFGYLETAKALLSRGAQVADLATAAGLGETDAAAKLLPDADAQTRHRALALAAQHGHAAVVAQLLDAGEDPNRYNPKGHHAHTTPLHQAALAGHEEVVRLLVERGARVDMKDTIYHGTPLGWARHGGHRELAEYLSAKDSPT